MIFDSKPIRKTTADGFKQIVVDPVAKDRRNCYWLYVVINSSEKPVLQEPIKDPEAATGNEIPVLSSVETTPRALTTPEVKEAPPPLRR